MSQRPLNQQKRRLYVFIANLINIIVLVGLWSQFWIANYAESISRPFGYKGHWLVFALYGVLLVLFTHTYGGYKVGHHRQLDIFFSGMLGLLIANIFNYIQTCLLAAKLVSFFPVIEATALGMIIIFLWSMITERIYKRLYPPYQMLMIYDGKSQARDLITKITTRGDKYQICQAIDVHEDQKILYQTMGEYSSVILSDIDSKERNNLLKYGYAHNISIYTTPKLSDVLIRSAENIELFDSPLLLSQNTDLSVEQRTGKRIMDIIISIIGIIVAFPFMLIIAIAIKLDDGGPAFYTQERLTLGGKTFPMLKFRSMVVDADKIDGPRLASQQDPRITRVGRFLRKIRFDELPQLFNILKGEMSVVGPRPEHPDIAAAYEESIPEFAFRLNVKAGLTGYAQVVGKYNTTPYDKIKLDLIYITSYSFLLDLKIMLMTPKILFKFDSTEGISETETIATIHKDDDKEKK